MYLLDTNLVSELRRPDRADAGVLTWAVANPLSIQYLSAITILELEWGAERLTWLDPAQGKRLKSWIQRQVIEPFEGRILPVDVAVAQRCASLHVPDPRGERDALIGATALVHALTLVTRNVSDFAPMGVQLINPCTNANAL